MTDAILIDGEIANELALHVDEVVDGHPLWASRFIITNKEACIKAHREFVKAGAQVLRTNTYQASAEGFIKHMNVPPSQAIEPIVESVEICRKAIALENKPDVVIGGSIGPIGAWRGDGSEYTGNYCNDVTAEEYVSSHRHRFEAFVKNGVKLLCIETIPCSSEALALLDLLKEYPHVQAWLSFSVKSPSEISNGEIFAEVAAKCWKKGKDQLVAVGVNCVRPQWVTQLFKELKQVDPTIPFIAYPNSGEKYDTEIKEWVPGDSRRSVADYVPEWLEMGIKYIGGCCRNSAKDMREIKSAVDQWKEMKRKESQQ